MKKLTRDEVKKVMGGDAPPDACTSDADCVTGIIIYCNGVPTESGSGRCYGTGGSAKTCHYSVGC